MPDGLIDPFDGYDEGGEAAAFDAQRHHDDDYVLPPSAQGGDCDRCDGSGLIYRRGPGSFPDTCSCRAGQRAANSMTIG